MMSVVYVAAGGALGAVLRFGFGKASTSLFGLAFPYATLGVNVIGSFIMGFFIGLMAKHSVPHEAAHLFIAVGLLGGFTTFSSFSLDAVSLFQRGEWGAAGLYVGASMVLSIAALIVGLWVMR